MMNMNTNMNNTFRYTKHRELWLWLYNHPSKMKDDWFINEESSVFNECYACEYALENGRFGFSCGCPLQFKELNPSMNDCLGGLYKKYMNASLKYYRKYKKLSPKSFHKQYIRRKRAAKKIANLSVKEGVNWI